MGNFCKNEASSSPVLVLGFLCIFRISLSLSKIRQRKKVSPWIPDKWRDWECLGSRAFIPEILPIAVDQTPPGEVPPAPDFIFEGWDQNFNTKQPILAQEWNK